MADLFDLDELNEQKDKRKYVLPKQNELVENIGWEDPSILDYGQDIFMSGLQGPVDAIENFDDYMQSIAPIGYVQFTDAEGNFDLDYIAPSKVTDEMLRHKMLPTIHDPKTAAGHFSKGVTQFLSGMYLPTKFLKGAGLGGTMVKDAARGMTSGAVSDFFVFDPNEGNLSNMLVEQDIPLLNNAVSRYLAIDGDDTATEARLKMVLEGVFIGGPLEVFMGIRAVRKAKYEKNFEKKQKIYDEHSKAMDDVKRSKKTRRVKKILVEDDPAINTNEAIKDFKITKNTTEADIENLFEKIFNKKGFRDVKSLMATIKSVSQLFTPEEAAFLKGNKTLENKYAKWMGERLGEDVETVLKTIEADGDAAELSIFKLIAGKKVMQILGKQLDELSVNHTKKYDIQKKKRGTDAHKKSSEQILALRGLLKHMTLNTKRIITGAARTTQAGNIKVARGKKQPILDMKKMNDIIESLDGDADAIAREIAGADLEDAVIDIATETHKNKYIKAFQSLYINSLLSSHWTQSVNLISNAVEATLKPATQMIGGAMMRDGAVILNGFARYRGMIHNATGMWAGIWKALKNGDAVLDKKLRTQDYLDLDANGNAISPISAEGLDLSGTKGMLADWIGHFAQFPSRLLIGGDEFFKQLNYRGKVYANAIENVGKRNIDLTSKEGKEQLQKILDDAFDSNGKANTSGDSNYRALYEDALEYSREATFQKELKGNENFIFLGGSKDWGSTFEQFAGDHPSLRFVVPFIRTPTNLWRNFETHIPWLGTKSKVMKALYESGPAGKADVLGRQALGTSVVLIGWDYATSYETVIPKGEDGKPVDLPKMTGRGPRDSKTRQLWRAAGWAPYSILVNDGTTEKPKWRYKQYNRMDPRFYAFGIISDIAEFSKMEPEAFDGGVADDIVNLAAGVLSSIMINIGDKSYTKGIGDTIEMMSDPTPNRTSLYFGKMASNFAPYGALRRTFETEQKDFRGFADRVIDGFSYGLSDLETKRDIFGEKIMKDKTTIYLTPSHISKIIQGPALIGRLKEVDSEMNDSWVYTLQALSVKGKLTLSPPQQIIKGGMVDLAEFKNEKGQTAFDRWHEIMSEMGLKDKLRRKVNSGRFQRSTVGNRDYQGRAEMLIEKEYNRIKDKAYRQLEKEFPELKDVKRDIRKEKRYFKKGSGDEERTNPGRKNVIDKLIVY
ncbi:protein transporter sec31 [uncultured phage_MedDCM-OCT-S28-C10]|uniref:Protein transporter sec31 n=1 Tax=uncultured phage_MedDCM-OCT-S28-C10 TaxID=2741077 RepID=A0A6S4PAC4_9CAUD|nr:protein transporter sec31 [uncultured phage_MedDCM-OCT-S28-C10]BAQ94050.1 protein transporter sec31 [uncultured phage_MedDCM-OCT-S28-C10]